MTHQATNEIQIPQLHTDGLQWLANYYAQGGDSVYIKDLDDMTRCIHHYDVDTSNDIEKDAFEGSISIDPRVISLLRDRLGIVDDIIVIGDLSGDKYLARTFSQETFCPGIHFFVFNVNNECEVILSFEWPMAFYWNNFGMGRRGGCMIAPPTDVQFKCVVSSQGNYAVIIGPATCGIDGTDNYSALAYPSVKLLDVQNAHVEDIELFHDGKRVWPVAILLDVGCGPEATAVMICDGSCYFRYQNFIYSEETFLGKYDFRTKKWIHTFRSTAFSASVLQPVQQDRLLCAEVNASWIARLWIINAQTLEPVCVHSIPDVCDFHIPAVSLWHVLAVESISKRRLHVLFWHFTDWEGQKSSFVVSIPLPFQPNCCDSLKHICRVNILKGMGRFDKTMISSLPLPQKLCVYLEGYE